jgi:NADPH:quinone reductase-like Zn-dependent oxidoreductase
VPETMLAGRSDVRTRDFAIEAVPEPSPGPGEVLVRVAPPASACPTST